MSMRLFAPAAVAAACFASFATAMPVNPFTEDFSDGASGWLTNLDNPVTFVDTGTEQFIQTTEALSLIVPPGPPAPASGTVLRGESGASGDAFAGNWIDAGVREFSFDVRHFGPSPLNFGVRIAPPTNFPGAIAVDFVPVLPGVWTTITFEVSPTSTDFISFSGGDFNSVFSNVGNLQIQVLGDVALSGEEVTIQLDNVSIVPAPASVLALLPLGAGAARRRR
ncbi:MAG: hypothetical protein AAGI30_03010 [Planctomycetota bacterium]